MAAQEPLDDRGPQAEDPHRAAAHQRAQENAGEFSIEVDGRGTVKHVSASIQAVLGYPPSELLQHGSSDWIHEDDREQLLERVAKTFSSGDSERTSCRLHHADGSWRMFELVASPYRSGDDGPRRIVIHARDLLGAWQEDLAVRASLERSRLVDEMSRDVLLMIMNAENNEMVWANSGLLNLTGYTLDDFRCADDVTDKIHPDDRGQLNALWYDRPLELGVTVPYSAYRFRIKDGSYIWLEGSDRLFETVSGERQNICVVRDVTKQHEAMEELRESEERYRIINELNQDIILLQGSEDGRLLWANSALCDVLGYTTQDIPDAAKFFAKVHPDDRERVTQVFDSGQAEVGDTSRYEPYRIRHKDGSWRWITSIDTLCENDRGERWTILAVRDVTEEVQAEEDRRRFADQIKETQRLESLGVMAGGIAHDFNNLLTPIVGETSLALLDVPADSPLQGPLLKIKKAAQRAAALTNQMLTYSGKGAIRIEAIDLSRLVEDMAQLLESTVSGGAVLSYSFEDGLPAVEGDSSQLSQIVMNLISNATEAVEEAGGRISIRTGLVDSAQVDLENLIGSPVLTSESYVFVEVSDDGCGMPARTRSRIFDPFFTTKFTGRGLGLASVLGIVRRHHGLIVLDSEVGRGTRFQVLLPAAPWAEAGTTQAPQPRESWHGDTTVLVVDDDEGVRELAEATLRRANVNTLVASNGHEGLDLFRRHANEIQAVVLDRTMPTLSGDLVFERIRRINPNVAIILMSGYSKDVALDHIGKDLDAFLQKPFEPETLIDTIRRAVEARSR